MEFEMTWGNFQIKPGNLVVFVYGNSITLLSWYELLNYYELNRWLPRPQ